MLAGDHNCRRACSAQVTSPDPVSVRSSSDPVALIWGQHCVPTCEFLCMRNQAPSAPMALCGHEHTRQLGSHMQHPSTQDLQCWRSCLWSHPCHPAVAELLIPITDSSVAPARCGFATWGARRQVCINPVCHSKLSKWAELTAPHQRQVQIKK